MHGGWTRGVSSPRVRRSTRDPKRRETAVVVLVCLTSGAVAVAGGALAALLAPGRDTRAVVWASVTLVLAAAAGLWWGSAPLTDRLRTLGYRPRVRESRREPPADREVAADLTRQWRR